MSTEFPRLYREAFLKYGTHALWHKRLSDQPTREDALVVARALRIEGDREARLLAEPIEQACRAADEVLGFRSSPTYSAAERGTRLATSE